jgi:hypothetical protein
MNDVNYSKQDSESRLISSEATKTQVADEYEMNNKPKVNLTIGNELDKSDTHLEKRLNFKHQSKMDNYLGKFESTGEDKSSIALVACGSASGNSSNLNECFPMQHIHHQPPSVSTGVGASDVEISMSNESESRRGRISSIKSLSLLSQNSQALSIYQRSTTNRELQQQHSQNSSHPVKPPSQLSRNSSTFSTKSRYSTRSSPNRCGNVQNGSISLSLTTANRHMGLQQQQHQIQQLQLYPANEIVENTSVTNRSIGINSNNGISVININRQNLFESSSLDSSSNASIYSLNNSSGAAGTLGDHNLINMREPIVIRGAGNITIFGVCNRFNEQFPSQLNAKLAPEEFRDTIKQINNILGRELSNSFKWLIFGSLFCCCTIGCSLLPVIYLNKKAKLNVNKFLEYENQRLYMKLGLKWKLRKMKCNSNSLLEYALIIEIMPTLYLYQPD